MSFMLKFADLYVLATTLTICVGCYDSVRMNKSTTPSSQVVTVQASFGLSFPPNGCSRTGEFQLCPLQSGTITYENGGKPIKQVALANNGTDAYVISRIDVTRAAGQKDWQEVGVFKCRLSDGFGCNLSPPGQIVHGIDEVFSGISHTIRIH